MKTKQFKKKAGAQLPAGITPKIAGRALSQIAKESGGELTPAEIVRRSRPKKALLHDCFEWNNSVAGAMYREQQARYLIRAITVEFIGEGRRKKPIVVRAFVTDQDEDGAGIYRSITSVMGNKEARAALLQRALHDIIAWERRYKELNELAVVFGAIARLRKRRKAA